MTKQAEQIKERYQDVLRNQLKQYTCIPDIENRADVITTELFKARQSLRQPRVRNDEPSISVFIDILVKECGAEIAENIFLSFIKRGLVKHSIYIPSEKNIKKLLA